MVAVWLGLTGLVLAGALVGVMGTRAGQSVSETAVTTTAPRPSPVATPLPTTPAPTLVPQAQPLHDDLVARGLNVYGDDAAVGWQLATDVCRYLAEQNDIHGFYNAQAAVLRSYPLTSQWDGFDYVWQVIPTVCPDRFRP